MFNNFNPYQERTSHIMSTRLEFTRVRPFNVIFTTGSIVDKLNTYKVPLDILLQTVNGDSCDAVKELPTNISLKDYLTEEEIDALALLNYIFSPFSNYNRYNVEFSSIYTSDSSIKNLETTILSLLKSSVNRNIRVDRDPLQYPYQLNTIDTGVPTDLYYRMSIIDGQYLKVTLYQNFFDYILNNDKHHIYEFVKNLLIKSNEQLTLDELARTQLFRNYINILGTSQI